MLFAFSWNRDECCEYKPLQCAGVDFNSEMKSEPCYSYLMEREILSQLARLPGVKDQRFHEYMMLMGQEQQMIKALTSTFVCHCYIEIMVKGKTWHMLSHRQHKHDMKRKYHKQSSSHANYECIHLRQKEKPKRQLQQPLWKISNIITIVKQKQVHQLTAC